MTDDASSHGPARQPSRNATAPTTWGHLVAGLLRCAGGLGLDPEALRASLHIDPEALRDPDGRVPLDALYALVERVARETGDELAPLRLAEHLDLEAYDALGLLAISSATLGEALDHTIRYQRVFAEGERYELEAIGEHVHVRYTPWGPPREAHVAMADMFVRDVAVQVRLFVGAPIAGARARLRRRPPRDRARFESLLGVPVELQAPRDEVILPKAAMALAIPRADPVTARFFARYLDARLEKIPERSAIAQVRRAVEELLPKGELTLDAVAARTRSSARTLQRRLAEEGTSFGALVEELRRERALSLVAKGAPLAEVSWLLGYSEPSAFHRAFRRWTGKTPRAWRDAHR